MSQLRVNTYAILDRAIEEGIAYGWRRAHKHDDKPDEFTIQERIHDEVMNAVCEVFVFDHSDEEAGKSGGEEGKGESTGLLNRSGNQADFDEKSVKEALEYFEEDARRRAGIKKGRGESE